MDSPLLTSREEHPHELERLLRAMLRKSPSERPTASEVAANLEGISQPRLLRRRTAWIAASVASCVPGRFDYLDYAAASVRGQTYLLESLPLDSEPASQTDPLLRTAPVSSTPPIQGRPGFTTS